MAQTEMSPDRIAQTERSHTLLSTGVSFADTVKYMFIVYSHERFNPKYILFHL